MKPYIVVEESEAVEDGKVKEGYEKRAYCYVKLLSLEPTEAQLYEAAIKAKESEILRRQAVAEIEAEKAELEAVK